MLKPANILTFIACIAISSSLPADIIVYDDLESPGMFFTNVTESSVNETLPLFGQPTIEGNSLVFDNPGFDMTVNAGQLDFTDGRMTVTVTAKNSLTISSLTVSEFGGYEITGSDAIVSVNGIGFATAENDIYQSEFEFVADAAGVGQWSDSMIFNFANPVESFSFVLDNQLFASAAVGSSAQVYKERIEITIGVVPEPASTAIIILALAVTGLRRRKAR